MKNPDFLSMAFFNQVEHWHDLGNGMFKASCVDNSNILGPHLEYTVTSAELASVHRLLPKAMYALSEYRKDHDIYEPLDGADVLYTLLVLNGEYLNINDIHGRPHMLVHITTFAYTGSNNGQLFLHAAKLATRTAEIEGALVEFVTWFNSTHCVVTEEALNKDYPGWADRWQLSTELGLPMNELIPHVFGLNDKPLSPQNISGLTFD